jgi:hypothetical protein
MQKTSLNETTVLSQMSGAVTGCQNSRWCHCSPNLVIMEKQFVVIYSVKIFWFNHSTTPRCSFSAA